MDRQRLKAVCDEAENLRRQWKAGNWPASHLLELCEANDVLVLLAEIDRVVSGAFVRSRRYKTDIVLINVSGKSLHHQRFTLAHEIGHLRLHGQKSALVEAVHADQTESDLLEKEANTFAAALLVPLKALTEFCRASKIDTGSASDRQIIEVARRFGVSHEVALRRLAIIGRLDMQSVWRRIRNTDWDQCWKTYAPEDADLRQARPIRRWSSEGVSLKTAAAVARFPDAYRELAFTAYREGVITAGRLAEVLELPDVEAVLNELKPLILPGDKNEMELQAVFKKLGRSTDE